MTTYTLATNNTQAAIEIFRKLGTDEQLAWLWFVYKQMGDAVTPAAPGTAGEEIAGGLYRQVEALSQPDQLEAMRAIARRDQNNRISREYGSLSDNTRLAFWFFLAQGMDKGVIIPMPDNYQLSPTGADLLAAMETVDFETQITVLRQSVDAMGSEPKQGAAV